MGRDRCGVLPKHVLPEKTHFLKSLTQRGRQTVTKRRWDGTQRTYLEPPPRPILCHNLTAVTGSPRPNPCLSTTNWRWWPQDWRTVRLRSKRAPNGMLFFPLPSTRTPCCQIETTMEPACSFVKLSRHRGQIGASCSVCKLAGSISKPLTERV